MMCSRSMDKIVLSLNVYIRKGRGTVNMACEHVSRVKLHLNEWKNSGGGLVARRVLALQTVDFSSIIIILSMIHTNKQKNTEKLMNLFIILATLALFKVQRRNYFKLRGGTVAGGYVGVGGSSLQG